MELNISPELRARFSELRALICYVESVVVLKDKPELELFKREIIEETRRLYTLETVKDTSVFRAYRDFYWRIGIDPTKTRPSGEALVRRILAGKPLPKINTLVDAYNLASVKTGIAIGAFDLARIKGKLLLRTAKNGEKFMGIGMPAPEILRGNEPVVADDEKLIAIYPYRDSDETKVSESTRDVLLLICGVPGVPEAELRKCAETTVEFITRFCDGRGKHERH
jgi:DNA/RNA-binding domain of Phe-tRNA-synthetase-like protein